MSEELKKGEWINIWFSDHIFNRPDTTARVNYASKDGIMIPEEFIPWEHIMDIEVVE